MKNFFKFLGWILGFRKQYDAQFKSYRKGGLTGKIVTLVLSLAAVGLSIWLEIVTLKMFSSHFGWAILLAILSVAVISTLVKTCGIYSVVAFVTAVKTDVDKKIDKAVCELDQKVEGLSEVVDECKDIIEPEQKQQKPHKWFDILAGCLFGIASIGLLVTAIVLLFLKLQMVI